MQSSSTISFEAKYMFLPIKRGSSKNFSLSNNNKCPKQLNLLYEKEEASEPMTRHACARQASMASHSHSPLCNGALR